MAAKPKKLAIVADVLADNVADMVAHYVSAGHDVIGCMTGQEIFEACGASRPDLIVVGDLPDYTHWEWAHLFTSVLSHSRPDTVALYTRPATAAQAKAYRARCYECGFDAVHQKSVSANQLTYWINKAKLQPYNEVIQGIIDPGVESYGRR